MVIAAPAGDPKLLADVRIGRLLLLPFEFTLTTLILNLSSLLQHGHYITREIPLSFTSKSRS